MMHPIPPGTGTDPNASLVLHRPLHYDYRCITNKTPPLKDFGRARFWHGFLLFWKISGKFCWVFIILKILRKILGFYYSHKILKKTQNELLLVQKNFRLRRAFIIFKISKSEKFWAFIIFTKFGRNVFWVFIILNLRGGVLISNTPVVTGFAFQNQ